MDNTWSYIIIGALALVCVLQFLKRKGSADADDSTEDLQGGGGSFKGMYRRRFLFTKNERQYYYIIKDVADAHGLHVFAKVRLADIVEPVPKQGNRQALFNRIRSKHVDFMLCSPTVTTICVIEIDDSSHDTAARKERDSFVDEILSDCGILVIRERHLNKDTLTEKLRPLIGEGNAVTA